MRVPIISPDLKNVFLIIEDTVQLMHEEREKKVECYFNQLYKLTNIVMVFKVKHPKKDKIYSIEPYEIAIVKVKNSHILAISYNSNDCQTETTSIYYRVGQKS